MDIKIEDTVVGKLYVNIQLSMDSLNVASTGQIIDLIKGTNGQTKQVFKLDIGNFTVGSFRRVYRDNNGINIEGAQLEPAI